MRALTKELVQRAIYLEPKLKTLYIGGGTPTVLPEELLIGLLDQIHAHVDFDEHIEITLEANPGTIHRHTIEKFVRSGIHRVSLGIQSLRDEELRLLGRTHTAKQALQALEDLFSAGVDQVSVDLMANIPGQTTESFADTLRSVLAYPISHLSIYDLKVEEGTPFGRWQKRGELHLPEEDMASRIDRKKDELLDTSTMGRYEISNYARNQAVSKHNLVYWHNEPYLGIGLGSTSRLDQRRLVNHRTIGDYINGVHQTENAVAIVEMVDAKMEREETIFLGLRLTKGVELGAFKQRHGLDLMMLYGQEIQKFLDWDMLLIADGHLRLTELGRRYSNQVLSLFV